MELGNDLDKIEKNSENGNKELEPLVGNPQRQEKKFWKNLKSTKFRLWRNIIAFSAAAAVSKLVLTLLASLQSSINYKQGVGTTSMAVGMVAAIPACFLFQPLHKRFDLKYIIVFGFIGSTAFVLANLYLTWYTMVPASIVSGITNSCMGIASKVYIAHLAFRYCQLANGPAAENQPDRVQSRMFMIQTLFYKTFAILAFPISSLIMGFNVGQHQKWQVEGNVTEGPLKCGANYCNEGFQQSQNSSAANEHDQYMNVVKLAMFCLGSIFVSALIVLFVVKEIDIRRHNPMASRRFSIKIMADPKILMIMPSFMVLYGCDFFWTLDISAAFITCPLGVEYVGIILMWTGISAVAACLIFGSFNTRKFRKIPLLLSPIIHLSILVILLNWQMRSNVIFGLSALSAGWYFASGIKMTLLDALVAVVFPNNLESAYSVLQLWGCVSTTLIAAWSNWLCAYIKIYIMMAIVLANLLGFIALEIVLYQERNRDR